MPPSAEQAARLSTVDPPEEEVTKEPERVEPKQEPKEEPKATETQTEKEADPEPEPADNPDSEPEPEPNPYANASLSGVYIATIDGVVHYGKWFIEPKEELEGRLVERLIDGGLVCFTERERDRYEAQLDEDEIEYTTSSLYVDPLLYEIVEGKTFSSRSEAIAYIESVIAGD